MRCEDPRVLWFEGCRPHSTQYVMTRAASGWVGAYYVLAPKKGSLSQSGSIERNLDFPVNPEWIFHFGRIREDVVWKCEE